MVKIRLTRVGKKKKPSYRIVVADSRSPRDGKIISQIGHYDPMCDPILVKIDKKQMESWVNKGAQLSNAVRLLLKVVS